MFTLQFEALTSNLRMSTPFINLDQLRHCARGAMLVAFSLMLTQLCVESGVMAQRSMSIGASQEFASSAGFVRSDRVDDSHIVVLYKTPSTSTASDLYARVGEVDTSDQSITWGEAKLVESELNTRTNIKSINETQLVVAHQWSDGEGVTGVARVLTIDVDQDTITVGDTTVFHNASIDAAFTHNPISIAKLTDESFAMCFADDATDNGKVVIGNISGSTLILTNTKSMATR